MTELVKNAWLGWLKFTGSGKLPALLFAALIFLWLSGKWKRQKGLFSYTVLMVSLCVLPVTAAGLMLYQTRFYDYEWIWSLVPMTIVIAWCAVEFLSEYWRDFSADQWKRGLPVTILLLTVLALSSGLGQNGFDRKAEKENRQQAKAVLSLVIERQGEDICLWAPRELLEYAREQSGSLRLLYGRNMWEEALNAYTYDTYPQEIQELYLWMENADPSGVALIEEDDEDEVLLKGDDCVAMAAAAGVDCIILPDSLEEKTVELLAEDWDGSVSEVGGYYLLTR